MQTKPPPSPATPTPQPLPAPSPDRGAQPPEATNTEQATNEAIRLETTSHSQAEQPPTAEAEAAAPTAEAKAAAPTAEAQEESEASSEIDASEEPRTPWQRYRRHGLRVTDLRDQLWCEKQLEFTLEHGREQTEAMREGEERHRELHEEITEVIEVRPRSREDLWALHLFNAWAGLQQLTRDGICRELPVFGFVDRLWVVGIIDQLEVSDDGKALILTDTKTRRSPRLPTMAQKRTTRLQMMLYRMLFLKLAREMLREEDFFSTLSLDPQAPFTPSFAQELQEVGLPALSLDLLLPLTLRAFQSVPPLSPHLVIRYEWQQDQSLLGEDRFRYHAGWLRQQLEGNLLYWYGEREAHFVDPNERWKCRYCSFQQQCPLQNPQGTVPYDMKGSSSS